MSNLHNNNHNAPSQNLQVWYCEHCRSIHFRTQNVMLDLSKKEFVELTNAILEICQNHFQPIDFSQFANQTETIADDILSSEIVS